MAEEMNFGERVRGRREALGMTRADLVRVLKENGHPMHQTTLTRIENGESVAKIPDGLALAKALRTTLSEMVYEGNEPGEAEQLIYYTSLHLTEAAKAWQHWDESRIGVKRLYRELSALPNNGGESDEVMEGLRWMGSYESLFQVLEQVDWQPSEADLSGGEFTTGQRGWNALVGHYLQMNDETYATGKRLTDGEG